MANEKENLYLFEAIELRSQYDRLINLLENTLNEDDHNKSFLRNEEEIKEPAKDFNPNEIDEQLKKIQTKRVKLNQEIQKANFTTNINFDGEKISLAEALDVRKNLNADLNIVSEKVKNSAYKKIIYKEKRDIVHEPKISFLVLYKKFNEDLARLKTLTKSIHIANHKTKIAFKEE